ncbi:hypothetical protein SASPL_141117 [Salvia splendens]|uniref:Xaa-Pro aminopeptidase n=1 Tax=Salvia splendens TaxID=180675 RepID=A0A8X8WRN0_SALSN|nr:hypothetical protein SASPL_141117 [Salvia splendens]
MAAALRALMLSHSPPLDALVVPSEDYHQSEYVSARDKRANSCLVSPEALVRISADGLALITANGALLWTDGRYFLQAEQQLTNEWKLMPSGEDPAVDVWMADNLPTDAAIGIDPWCISVDTAHKWERAFAKKQQKLIQTTTNLVDEVWTSRPPPEANPVVVHPIKFPGSSLEDKLKQLREELRQEKARAIVLSALDEASSCSLAILGVAWLLNVRGSDVSYSPVVHAFAIVTSTAAFFYVDKRKVSSEVGSYMEKNSIELRDYSEVSSDAVLLASDQLMPAKKAKDMVSDATETGSGGINTSVEEKSNDLIWVDPGTCCFALYSKLNQDKVFLQPSPFALAKSLKNPVEIQGLRMHIYVMGQLWYNILFGWINRYKNYYVKLDIKTISFLAGFILLFSFTLAKRPPSMQEIYGASGYIIDSEVNDKNFFTCVCTFAFLTWRTTKLTEVSVSDKLEEFRASKEHFRGLSFPTISSVGPNGAFIHYNPELETCAELDPNQMYLCDSGAQYLDGTTDITRTVHFGKPTSHEKACYTAVLKGHIGLGNARFPSGTTGHVLDVLARVPLWKYGLDYRHGTGHGIGSYLNVHEGPHQISFRPPARHVPLQSSMTLTDVIFSITSFINFSKNAPYQTKLIDTSLLVPEEVEWLYSYQGHGWFHILILFRGEFGSE